MTQLITDGPLLLARRKHRGLCARCWCHCLDGWIGTKVSGWREGQGYKDISKGDDIPKSWIWNKNRKSCQGKAWVIYLQIDQWHRSCNFQDLAGAIAEDEKELKSATGLSWWLWFNLPLRTGRRCWGPSSRLDILNVWKKKPKELSELLFVVHGLLHFQIKSSGLHTRIALCIVVVQVQCWSQQVLFR